MPPIKELTGVVSIDLRNEPQFPFDPHAAAAVAVGLAVNSEESYAVAAKMIQESAACIDKVEQFYEAEKNLAYRLHKTITEKVAKFTASWRTVRPTLEPRMKAFRKQQEDLRRAEEERLAREARAAVAKAEAEAAEIRRKAEEEAARLRREGEMRAAREVEAQAAVKAEETVLVADSLADLGTIAPAERKFEGVGESLPWKGEVVSVRDICRAIGDGTIPLLWLTPVRGQGPSDVPLVDVNMTVLNNIAKRMGKEDLGIPGARGVREVQLKFSKQVSIPTVSESDGW